MPFTESWCSARSSSPDRPTLHCFTPSASSRWSSERRTCSEDSSSPTECWRCSESARRSRQRKRMIDLRASVIAISYIVAAVLFIFGLKQLSSPSTARAGNRLAAIGMAVALIATLIDRQIVSFWTIAIGTLIGAAVGIYFGRTVQMTAMPQMVALFNGMGGATAALVSVAEYLRLSGHGEVIGVGEATSIVLGTAIGAISFTGSIIAFGKLQEILPGRPLQFPLQRFVNGLILLSVIALGAMVVASGGTSALWLLFAAALLLGAMFVLPIGAGAMPGMLASLTSV